MSLRAALGTLKFDLGGYNYWIVILLLMTGLFIVISKSNMVKTVIGLNFIQVAVILFYVSMGKVSGGTAPILVEGAKSAEPVLYSNPLPHTLMLTAIVVGVATTAVALALVVRVNEAYGTIEEDEVLEQELGSES